MNFRDYKWFRNPRGLHNNGPYFPLNATRYTGTKMGWAKLVVGGTEQVEVTPRLIEQGCMPIVRIFRERMGAMPALDSWYDIYRQYLEAGCRWFELYDEPNLASSWPSMRDTAALSIDWNNIEGCIKPLMDNWLDWAERIIEMGGYPAFPAMAETTEPRQATLDWLVVCMAYLRDNQAVRFANVLSNGLWCATHPYVLNHYYQEPPGGPSYIARPYYQQSAAEGGWHFEYPYDPLQQRNDPGRTIFGGTQDTPHGDPNGLVATGQAFQELLKKTFDAGPVPVVGTTGGIGPIPGPDDEPVQQDKRYPPFSRDSHAEATLAMWRWIAHQGPPWLFGLTLSTEAEYYDQQGAVPAIELMLIESPILKEVPDLDISCEIAPEEEEDIQPVPAEPLEETASPASIPFDMVSEPLEGAALDAFLGGITEPSTLPPEEDAFGSILFEESEIEMEMSPEEEDSPEELLVEEPEPEMEEVPGPFPDEVFEAEMEMPPLEAVTSPEEEDSPEELLVEEPEPEMEEAPGPFPDEVFEAEMEMPPLEAVTSPEEEDSPEELPVEEPEPEMEEAPETVPDEVLETEAEMPPFEAFAPRDEVKIAEPIAFEDSGPDLEPIPFEEWDNEPLSEVSPIEMVLPELAWDYNEEFTTMAETRSLSDKDKPMEPAPDEKVLPQMLQDVSTIDDLRSGPPPAKLDYHFLVVASGLSPEWLFQTAYRYWHAFRPTALPNSDLMGLLPEGKSIAVTLLATGDTVREMHDRIHDQWPDVYIDPVVFNTPEAMRAELDRRAVQDQRFGQG